MKKKNKQEHDIDAELLRMYLMGAANPGFGTKINYADDVVDLHLSPSQVGKGKIEPQNALFHQLERFENALDRAIAAGKMEFRVVHGHGKGKLKEEIHKLLKKHPQVKNFKNDYHSRYGYGSTVIYLK